MRPNLQPAIQSTCAQRHIKQASLIGDMMSCKAAVHKLTPVFVQHTQCRSFTYLGCCNGTETAKAAKQHNPEEGCLPDSQDQARRAPATSCFVPAGEAAITCLDHLQQFLAVMLCCHEART